MSLRDSLPPEVVAQLSRRAQRAVKEGRDEALEVEQVPAPLDARFKAGMTAGEPMPLTPPERAAERAAGWKAVDRVKSHGGCFCCLNRDRSTEGWDTSVCGLKPALQFPDCVKRNKFSPDFGRIYGRENIE